MSVGELIEGSPGVAVLRGASVPRSLSASLCRLAVLAALASTSLATAPDAPAARAPEASRLTVGAVARLGNRGADLATAIAIGSDGGVLVGMHFDGVLQTARDQGRNKQEGMVARGGGDIALVAFDPGLSPRWSRQFGGTAHDEVRSVVGVGAGFAIGGFFADGAGFGDGSALPFLTSQGASDGFIGFVDAQGKPLAAQRVGGKQADHVRALVTLEDGGLLVGGHFQAAARFAAGPQGVVIGAGGTDVFVQRLDVDRQIRWARTFGGTGDDELAAMVALPDGGAILLMRHDQPIQLRIEGKSVSVTPGSGHDALVVWLDANGDISRTVAIASTGSDELHHLALLDDGTLVVAGEFQGEQRWSIGSSRSAPLRSLGSTDVVVLFLDSSGRLQEQRQIGSVGPDTADALATDGRNAWLAVGWQGQLSLGTRHPIESEDTSALLLRVDRGGPADHWLTFEGKGVQKITALATQSGRVWATGVFGGELTAPGMAKSIESAGKSDVFVARIVIPAQE